MSSPSYITPSGGTHNINNPTTTTTTKPVSSNVHAAESNAHAAASNVQAAGSNAAYNAQNAASNAATNVKAAGSNAADKAATNAQTAAQIAAEKAHIAAQNAQVAAHNASAKAAHLVSEVSHHPAVQQVASGAQAQLGALDRELAKFGFLNEFEKRTKISKTYAVLGASVVLGFIIFLNFLGLASPVTNLIGWALPAYLSCLALESPSPNDDKHWLTYWIIFGLLNCIESAGLRLVLYYVPMYFTLKFAATLWLMLPATRGAEKVYYNALRPLFQTTQRQAKRVSQSSPVYSSNFSTNTNKTNTNRDTASTSSFSSAGTTNAGLTSAPTTGFSTSTDFNSTSASSSNKNPFSSTSAGIGGSASEFKSTDGLHTTSAGNTGTIGGAAVPPAAGVPLPNY